MNSAKRPAPALRTISGATTAGSSQTPYMNAWAGGKAVNAAPVAFHSSPHAQKTTPKAPPRTAVTTMSTVRQSVAVPVASDDDGRTACPVLTRLGTLRRHYAEQGRVSAS